MVIEKKPSISGPSGHSNTRSSLTSPSAYRVLFRIDERQDREAVTYMVEKAFGRGAEMYSRVGSRLSGRTWLVVGSFPREIAEARAEVVRRSVDLGRLAVGILIRKAD
ncbi:ATP-dependent Clp protease adaptor ClpS [Agrobacterium rubi]|nr:ATP-dependent Clp protease adaptor ClpS [Agrobacterium rubi]NTF23986.1 ATP-dependent Clp protease adaptor ClpS [Agrobacterium rubi]